MCSCTSCEYTDSFRLKGFDAWPRGEPAGQRSSEQAYAQHARHVWSGSYKTVQFTPGQAPVFPRGGYANPIPQNVAFVRWNAKYCKKYVPEPEPVKIPTMIDMARQMREQARAERKAIKEWAKQLRAA